MRDGADGDGARAKFEAVTLIAPDQLARLLEASERRAERFETRLLDLERSVPFRVSSLRACFPGEAFIPWLLVPA